MAVAGRPGSGRVRAGKAWHSLPRAEFVSFEAINPYDEFRRWSASPPRGNDRLLATDPQAAYLLFPEDREHPIPMSGDLPKRWIDAERVGPF